MATIAASTVVSFVFVIFAYLTMLPSVPRIEAVAHVNRPGSEVWNVVRDMRRWHEWNDVFRIDFKCEEGTPCLPTPGTVLTITCAWYDNTTDVAHERVTYVSDSTTGTSVLSLCWEYIDLPRWLLTTDRCIAISEVHTSRSRVVNYEQFGGPLAWIVYQLKANQVGVGFSAFNSALQTVLDS
mmetsp:Transcript_17144/g.44667  ORF Transcript_17144/g.44667 Transcript_17144/m.44667 type:complete len:182 (-) Transcript_17144:1770-2315(-)